MGLIRVICKSYCNFRHMSQSSVFLTSSKVHTILDAALKVVDDGSQDGRQVHYMSALSEAQSEQLIPTGSHQTCVCLLAETEKKKCEHVYRR